MMSIENRNFWLKSARDYEPTSKCCSSSLNNCLANGSTLSTEEGITFSSGTKFLAELAWLLLWRLKTSSGSGRKASKASMVGPLGFRFRSSASEFGLRGLASVDSPRRSVGNVVYVVRRRRRQCYRRCCQLTPEI